MKGKTKVKLEIEVELVDGVLTGFTKEEIRWFKNEVLTNTGSLILHSNEIGDTLGVVTKIKIIDLT